MLIYPHHFGRIIQNLPRNIIPLQWHRYNSKKCGEIKTDKVLRGKVAIVTGGACGIGFEFAKECLRKGAMGVTIADIKECDGERAAKHLCEEYGDGRCIFVRCDVTKSDVFDWTFKQTLKCFGQLDLLINNAGMLNDKKWEHAIATNIGGCVVGSLLGIQYMSKSCVGNGGLVINISSVYGITPLCGLPIYSMTHAGIISFSRALGMGSQYDRTGVRIVTLCIGPTCTYLLDVAPEGTMNDKFKVELMEELEDVTKQPPRKVAKGLAKIIKRAGTGSVWVACNSYPPFEIQLPDDIDSLKKET